MGRGHFMDFLQKEFSGEEPTFLLQTPSREGGHSLGPCPRLSLVFSVGVLALIAALSSAENLSFWEACEELRFGGQAQVPALVDAVYQ